MWALMRRVLFLFFGGGGGQQKHNYTVTERGLVLLVVPTPVLFIPTAVYRKESAMDINFDGSGTRPPTLLTP